MRTRRLPTPYNDPRFRRPPRLRHAGQVGDNEVPEPHPGLAEAERRVRAAIADASAREDHPQLALRHAELGMILAIQTRYTAAVSSYQTSLAHIEVLRTDGRHDQQRRARISSLASPPPGSSDFDLDRLEAEVRVAMVEALAAAGDAPGARSAIEGARPFTKGLLRRRLRRRLRRVEESFPASPGRLDDPVAVKRSLARAASPRQERGLRLRLANAYLDSGDFDSAVRESLLLIRDADAVGDQIVRAGARQVLGLGLEGQGRLDEGLSVLAEAFRDLRDLGDQQGMIGMGEALAQRLMVRGDAKSASSVLRTTERAAADAGNRVAELSSATMLGVVLDETGDRRAAVDLLDNVRQPGAGLPAAAGPRRRPAQRGGGSRAQRPPRRPGGGAEPAGRGQAPLHGSGEAGADRRMRARGGGAAGTAPVL